MKTMILLFSAQEIEFPMLDVDLQLQEASACKRGMNAILLQMKVHGHLSMYT